MSIKIEIQSNAIDERRGKIQRGERAGQDYHIRQQEGWVYNGKAYPERIVLSLGQDGSAFPVGMYEIDPASITVGEYGQLQFERSLKLVKLQDAKPAARSAA